MKANLILLPIINQIVLLLLPIKDFFINPMFNNKFMEYLIKWTTIVAYGISFIVTIISIYFLIIAKINKLEDENVKAKNKTKIGLILYLIEVTSTATTAALIIIFK